PTIRIAPNPSRWTGSSPPRRKVPDFSAMCGVTCMSVTVFFVPLSIPVRVGEGSQHERSTARCHKKKGRSWWAGTPGPSEVGRGPGGPGGSIPGQRGEVGPHTLSVRSQALGASALDVHDQQFPRTGGQQGVCNRRSGPTRAQEHHPLPGGRGKTEFQGTGTTRTSPCCAPRPCRRVLPRTEARRRKGRVDGPSGTATGGVLPVHLVIQDSIGPAAPDR